MNIKNVLSAVFVIVGSLVGAGFISGREISAFFLKGNFLFSVTIFAVCFVSFVLFLVLDDYFYNSFFYGYSSFLILIADIFMSAGLLSAADQIIARIARCRIFPFASIIIVFFSYFAQRRGMKNIENICKILTPAVIVLTVILILTSKSFILPDVKENVKITGVFSYVGLNVFVINPVLRRLKKVLNKKEVILTVSISAFLLIFLIVLIGFFIGNDTNAISDDLPLLSKFSNNCFSKAVFTVAILTGITTAVLSEHYSMENVLDNLLKEKGKQTKKHLLALPIVMLLISKLGFYNIVTYAYPIIGFIGGVTILICAIFRLFFRVRQRRDTLKRRVYTE